MTASDHAHEMPPADTHPAPALPEASRSPCPVAGTLDIVGDKWSLLIVRDLLSGKSRFRDLAASPERIATNILSSRLERLAQVGLIRATPSTHRAGSMEYHLTPLGLSLLPVLEAMRDWGLSHVRGTQVRIAVPPASASGAEPAGNAG